MDRDALTTGGGGGQTASRVEAEFDARSTEAAPGGKSAISPLAALRAASRQAAGSEGVRPAATKRSTLARDSMVVIRRAHLYAGLLMLPWVLLYGVTGILFNHPTWFSDQTIYGFDAEQMKGTELERLVTPEEIARSVVAAVSAKTGASYQLVERGGARFERGGLSASLTVDGKPYSASLDPVEATGQIREGQAMGGRGGGGGGMMGGGGGGMMGGGGGMMGQRGGGPGMMPEGGASAGGEGMGGRRGEGGPMMGGGGGEGMGGRRGGRGGRPGGGMGGGGEGRMGGGGGGEGRMGGGGMNANPDDPFAALGPVAIEKPILDQMKSALPTIVSRAGLAGKVEVSQVRASALSFVVEGAGKTWRATYDLASGLLSGQPESPGQMANAANELSTRRFLLRLHMAHGYPDEFNARWFWAVIVDVMSTLMVFWGVSGLVMWWQIKRTRRIGAASLLVSAAMAGWVFVAMHQELIGLTR
jgi:hypothetical protein